MKVNILCSRMALQESEKGAGMGSGKRRFGDRHDGRRLRSLHPYNAMIPFVMKYRGDSSNYFEDAVEITDIERFLRGKRLNGYPGMGFLHLFIATYIKTTVQYPGLNRFVSGQRVYTRDSIEFVMTIKKEMRADAPETSVKVSFDKRDTINDVYNKLNLEINKVKSEGEDTGTDNLAKFFVKLPRLILKLTVSFLGTLDYFGLLPKSIINASPFHGSVIITDLGSIGLNAVYHHLYNFGNLPLFIAIGPKRKTRELRIDGSVAECKYIDYRIVMDERICDGFYISQALKQFRSFLRSPQSLDEPTETIVEDVD